jgi:hypothetical protein
MVYFHPSPDVAIVQVHLWSAHNQTFFNIFDCVTFGRFDYVTYLVNTQYLFFENDKVCRLFTFSFFFQKFHTQFVINNLKILYK